MAYEWQPGLASPEDDIFATYDATMQKAQNDLYWKLGIGFVAVVGLAALFLTQLGR